MKNNNSLTKYQVKELQADVQSLKKDVREILENDLPNIREQITGISTQVKVLGAINVIGILAVIALTKLLK